MRGAVLLALAIPLFGASPAPLAIDYPLPNSLFPPDLAPPTFLFRDSTGAAAWRVEVSFAEGAPLRVNAAGEPLRVGRIDERCISSTNELPKLTPQQAASRTWLPDDATWEAIKARSVARPATVTISGLDAAGSVVSRGTVKISASADPVGAPIFFRDVPLMPAELEKGVIKPLPKSALPLVAWRLRYVNETESRLLIDDVPTCMNCHSFARDGKTMGLDLDGPSNDKGLYALASIGKTTTIANRDVVAWSSFKGKLGSKIRVGFMSQISPDARYVVTMVSPSDLGRDVPAAPGGSPLLPKDVQGNFYVANFKWYNFLQVFYPTRGILAWYSRETGKLQPLPGADDPRYVHTNATWSPDGKYLIFARAEARDPYPEGSKLAETANDPNETRIQYDLYRIPFNDGRGGEPEPVAGASKNGMSNSFPKISPDGKWLVYVQAKNGLLMRPDSKLYIVPAAGGKPRLMNANTPLMNSWHSFSPNGRWMVFSSKSRSPYTQMFLTHIDENGADTPPILIENATAANRAVNIPEFVNVGPDAWARIDAPATEFYRIADNALEFMQKGNNEAAIAEFRKALEMDPHDAMALNNLGAVLVSAGELDEAVAQFRKALESDPDNFKAHGNLGVTLARMGRFDEALPPLEKAVALNAEDSKVQSALGGVLVNKGRIDEAMKHLEKALAINPSDSDAHNNLGGILARAGKFDQAIPHFQKALAGEPGSFVLMFNLGRALAAGGRVDEGLPLVEQAADRTGRQEPVILDKLADLYAMKGRYLDAVATGRRAAGLAARQGNRQLVADLERRIAEYESRLASQ